MARWQTRGGTVGSGSTLGRESEVRSTKKSEAMYKTCVSWFNRLTVYMIGVRRRTAVTTFNSMRLAIMHRARLLSPSIVSLFTEEGTPRSVHCLTRAILMLSGVRVLE